MSTDKQQRQYEEGRKKANAINPSLDFYNYKVT